MGREGAGFAKLFMLGYLPFGDITVNSDEEQTRNSTLMEGYIP